MAIIKCPDCGQSVSNMAGTCPHCGVSIQNNIKSCPNCGTICFNAQEACPQCNTPLPVINQPNAATPDKATPEPDRENKTENKSEKRKTSHLAFVLSSIVLVIIIGSGLYYLNYQHRIQQEEADYARLAEVTNPEFYQQFLLDYPDSKYTAQVQQRMQQLNEEAADWNRVMSSKNRVDIAKFIYTHPHSVRIKICENMLDSIDWNEAYKLRTEEAVENYLSNHAEGLYVAEAATLKNELIKTKVTPQDADMIRGVLDAFFTNAIGKQSLDAIKAAIPEKMSVFNDNSDVTPEQIVAYAKKKIDKDVIGLHYLIGQEFRVTKEMTASGEVNYKASFALEETISRSDVTQPNTNTYRVTATLDAERKITSMVIK